MKALIRAEEVLTLRERNHLAYVYPRKNLVVVDGFKRYSITDASLDVLKTWNNGKVN